MNIPRGIQFWPTKLAEKWFAEYQRSRQLRNLKRRHARRRAKRRVA